MQIDATQVFIALISVVGSIIAPILTVLAYRLLKLNQESESRAVVATAIQNGISLVESQADNYAKTHGKLTVSNANVAAVANYVMPKVQESLDRLNVKGTGQGTPGDQLGEVIAAKIAQRLSPPPVAPVVPGAPAVVVTAAPTPSSGVP